MSDRLYSNEKAAVFTKETGGGANLCIYYCKCVMHLLSHHAPTGAWYFVDIIGSNIIVIAYTSGMPPR